MTGPEPEHPAVPAARRIGLMGGSFDPVHQAHVALATLALEQLALDEVRWLPVGQAWQKSRRLAPAQHRLEMVRLATRHEPRFVVDPLEIDRGGPSYTIDTVQALQGHQAPSPALVARWHLIIGQDQYGNFDTWHGWEELADRVTLAVANRGGNAPCPAPGLRRRVHHMVELPLPPTPLSSTEIRDRLARGEDVFSLAPRFVSESVARYIAQHQLYITQPC